MTMSLGVSTFLRTKERSVRPRMAVSAKIAMIVYSIADGLDVK